MKPFNHVGRFAVLFAIAIGLVVIFFAGRTNAAAVFITHGPTTASCNLTGGQVPATFQDNYFGAELHGFLDQEYVTISIQFPDGRIFSTLDTFLLDGVVDMPPHYREVYQTDVAGDLYFDFPVTNNWPYGCYKLTATGLGSKQVGVGYLAVTPRAGRGPAASPAKLAVWNNGTFDAFARHGSLVNIHGTGFLPNETISVWITRPDGVVIDYPQQVTSDIGSFQSSFVFSEALPTGRYTFTALGVVSGYQVFAPFELSARNSTPSGWAQLRVAYPYPASTSQNGEIAITGALFSPGEQVSIWMTLPNNAVRGLPLQLADGNGDFFAIIQLDERLPVGLYKITAQGLSSKRLVIAEFNVTQGRFVGVNPGSGARPNEALQATFVAPTSPDVPDHVVVSGSGYNANELIGLWLTLPNDSVVGLPQAQANELGDFAIDVTLAERLPIGTIRVSAQGVESGRLLITSFEVGRDNLTSVSAPQVMVEFVAATSGTASDIIVVTGKGFQAGEQVAHWMTLPDNSVRDLPSVNADENGNYRVAIEVGGRLPNGTVRVTARGLSTNRETVGAFDVPAGLNPGAAPAPSVDLTNVEGGTGGPTNIGGVEGSPGAEQTPPDQQRCTGPEDFWTPGC